MKSILLISTLLVTCSNQSDLIEGHWYVVYGSESDRYGEAIYANGKACFYSEEFGLRYRNYLINDKGYLEIFDDESIDNVRIIEKVSDFIMSQILIDENENRIDTLIFYKIQDSGFTYEGVLSSDSTEVLKMIDNFDKRKHKILE